MLPTDWFIFTVLLWSSKQWFFFFFFNRHCNPCGLWPAQLSLIILSRKVSTECRCQRHAKPPTWRTSDLELSNSRHQVSPTSETMQANPNSGRWNYGREISEEFCRKWPLPRHFWVLLRPLRWKARWDFFRPKNPTASAGFEPANLGTKGQHAYVQTTEAARNNSYLFKYY